MRSPSRVARVWLLGGAAAATLPGCGGGEETSVSGSVDGTNWRRPADCRPLGAEGCCAALCDLHAHAGCRHLLGFDGYTTCDDDEVAEICGEDPDTPLHWWCRPAEPGEFVTDCDGDGVPNVEDCAACDPELYQRYDSVTVDADGDGYSDGYTTTACGGPEFPAGYLTDEDYVGQDCDDSSPDVWRVACLDADEDESCASGSTECVGAALPLGYRAGEASWLRPDCDDGDPSVQLAAYADEDGDGWRAGRDAPSGCFPATDLPPGHTTAYGSDCDDHDPAVFPDQADVMGDGVDANCSGSDSTPCDDATSDDACPCWPESACSVEPSCSDSADLAIVDLMPGRAYCSGSQTAVAVVINRGGMAFSGEVVISAADFYGGDLRGPYCWFDTALDLTLEPGEGRRLEIDPLCQEVRIEMISGEDCDLENNVATFRTEVIECGGW